ncbi:MAG: DUF3617 family protein [Deltaproteobacteria bacterium]|nr:DUF3617 family protein [Deltaproteobacteria bacterium]
MTGKIHVVLMAAVLLCAAPVAAGPDMKEGSWEITTTTEMSGIAMKMPPQKHTQCLTKNDVIPKDPQTPSNCVIKQQKITGNTVTWEMECTGDNVKTVSAGSVTYTGESFSGTMDITMSGTDMKIRSTMTGRRMGPCQ